MPATAYLGGHEAATLSSHLTRSATNEASHVLTHVTSTSTILDVGCGPGSITCDLASLAPHGRAVGIDRAEVAISAAQAEARDRGITNATFQVADLFSLPFEDDSFDLVHCNAVLVHQADPVGALREMRRVCRVGGRVAARESDWDTYVVQPLAPALKRCGEAMRAVKVKQGVEPNAGRYLGTWAIEAGFAAAGVDVECDVTRCFGQEEVGRWGKHHAERMKTETVRKIGETAGIAEGEMEEWAEAWRAWGRTEGALCAVMHMRLVAVK